MTYKSSTNLLPTIHLIPPTLSPIILPFAHLLPATWPLYCSSDTRACHLLFSFAPFHTWSASPHHHPKESHNWNFAFLGVVQLSPSH